MNFIEIKPGGKKQKERRFVKVSYIKSKNRKFASVAYSLFLRIPIDIGEKAGLKKGDMVSFNISSENNRFWLIKKSDKGFKLGEGKGFLKITMVWHSFIPMPSERKSHSIFHEVTEEGLTLWPA